MSDLLKTIKALSAASQKLRVAVTKTSQQGEDAQAATPNLMSFSTDENSVWFNNNNKYGIWLIKGIKDITDNSTNEEIIKVLGPATEAHLKSIIDFISRGGICAMYFDNVIYPAATKYNAIDKTFSIVLFMYNTGRLAEYNYNFVLTDKWKCKTTHITIKDTTVIDIYKSALGASIQMPNTVGDIAAGTNVACIKNTSTTEHTEANWDPLGGTVDLSAYATKAEMNSGLNSKINTSAIKNDLTTGGVTNVLSAEQGKILKQMID